jgi:prepilin-type N-terminal cleavage/methylation domain-containing protein
MPQEMSVPPPPPRRLAFTLLEVMVAIVLTGIVVLLASSMAQAGLDARERLTTHLRTVQSTRAAREILRDALRSMRAGEPGDSSGGVVLSRGTLSFIAAGGAAPLDADYDWLFTISPGRGGLYVSAAPIGRAPPTQIAFTVPEVTRWDVWLLSTDGRTWQTEWNEPKLIPRAVAIAFWNGDRPSGLPLHIALWQSETPVVPDSLPGSGAATGQTRGSP